MTRKDNRWYEAGVDHGRQWAELDEGTINHLQKFLKHPRGCVGCEKDAELAKRVGWLDEYLALG